MLWCRRPALGSPYSSAVLQQDAWHTDTASWHIARATGAAGGAGGVAAALGNAGMAELPAEGACTAATVARAGGVTGARAGDGRGVVAGGVTMPKGLRGWVVAQVMSWARQIVMSCACLLCACTRATANSAMHELGGCCFPGRAGWGGSTAGHQHQKMDLQAGNKPGLGLFKPRAVAVSSEDHHPVRTNDEFRKMLLAKKKPPAAGEGGGGQSNGQ